MKILLHPINQSPTKPILPSLLRLLITSELIRSILIAQGHKVEVFRYVDDTSLKVGKLILFLKNKKFPQKNFLLWLGKNYVKAYSQIPTQKAKEFKALLEKKSKAKKILSLAIREEKKLLRKINISVGTLYWESQGLKEKEKLFQWLKRKKRIITLEKYGGGVFLDYTDKERKLMMLSDGKTHTFLFKLLLFFFQKAKNKDKVIVCYGDEEEHLFANVEEFLKELKKECLRIRGSRVKLGGKAIAARYGGWEEYTLEKIFDRFKSFSQKDINLGLRLYFLSFKPSKRFDFSFEELGKKITLARSLNRILDKFSKEIKQKKKVSLKENPYLSTLQNLKIENYRQIIYLFFSLLKRAKKEKFKDQKLIESLLILRRILLGKI